MSTRRELLLDDRPLDDVEEQQVVELLLAAVVPPPQLRVDGLLLECFLRPADPRPRWRWQTGGATGLREVLLTTADGTTTSHTVRVLPRKLDAAQYAVLLADLRASALALGTMRPGGREFATPDTAGRPPPLPDALLRRLVRAARLIIARPATSYRQVQQATPLARARGPIDLARLRLDTLQPVPPGNAGGALREALAGQLPETLPERGSVPTHDTYEQRLLKATLTLAITHTAASVPHALIHRQLRSLADEPLFATVGALGAPRSPTALMRQHPAYRAVYQCWRALRTLPRFTFVGHAFALQIADLPELYETWCALQAALALGACGTLLEQRAVTIADDVVTLQLPTAGPLVRAQFGDAELTLLRRPRYTPEANGFGSLDAQTYIPDLVIGIARPGVADRLLVLDAKYRVSDDGLGVPADALRDAYAYLGALGYDGQRAAIGALLLYPGQGAAEQYASGVGLVPLLPGAVSALAELLSQLLSP